jgi:hypothetical protein
LTRPCVRHTNIPSDTRGEGQPSMNTPTADTPTAFGFEQLFGHVIGAMANSVCERNGESKQQQFARSQAAVHTIMGFLPRDVIEAILAGRCVMFHELITDSVHETLRGEMDTTRRATRSGIVAMDRAFGANLARLERYQLRPSEGRRDEAQAQKEEVPAEVPVEVPVDAPKDAPPSVPVGVRPGPPNETPVKPVIAPRPVANTSRPTPAPAAVAPALQPRDIPAKPRPPVAETALAFRPSAEAIAACQANPEAMAALEAGDPERFARAMGLDMPSEAYLDAAAAAGSPFDRSQPSGLARCTVQAAPARSTVVGSE